METPLIGDKKFNKIRKHLPVPGPRKRCDDRLVISAIIWVIKKGASWREIPEFYENGLPFTPDSDAGANLEFFRKFSLIFLPN